MSSGTLLNRFPPVVMAFSVSVAIIGLVSLLGYLLRVLVRRKLQDAQLQGVLYEVITVSEMTVCGFELGTVYEAHGIGVYATCLFLLCTYQSAAWGDIYACPYQYVEDWYLQRIEFQTVVRRVIGELVGGWLAWRYTRALWWMELSPRHHNRWAMETCTADLKVTALQGALVEGGAVFALRLLARSLNDLQPRFTPVIKAFAGTTLVVAGFDYSGGYYNPVLASAMKMGCEGNTLSEHLMVYWAAATVGAVAAANFYPRLRLLVTGVPDKRE